MPLVKHSGFGRECASFGVREFVNVKSVQVGTSVVHGT